MSGVRRVIVGASGSPGSLRALRYAEELARAHDAALIPVHTEEVTGSIPVSPTQLNGRL